MWFTDSFVGASGAMISEIHPSKWQFSSFPQYKFVIPRIQRAYAWGQAHIDQFLDDLKTAQQNNDEHYFGAFYTARRQDGAHILIDGQQRFTTTFLFLHCAAQFTNHLNQMKINEIITEDRLKLGKRDQDDFISLLSRETSAKSTSKLHVAYDILSDFVASHKSDIDVLVSTLLNKFLMVQIHFPFNYVGNAFELINHRGKPLSDVELIKSHLFVKLELSDMSDRDLDDLDHKWKEMAVKITDAGDADIDTFIQHVLSLTNNGTTRLADIYTVFLDRLKWLDENNDTSGVVEKVWLDDLYDWHKKYLELLCPPDSMAESRKNHLPAKILLERIKELKAVSIYPILLAGYQKFFERSLQTDFLKLVNTCYKLHVNTMTLRDADESIYRHNIQSIARKLYSSNMTLNNVVSELRNTNAELSKASLSMNDILAKKFTRKVSKQLLLLIEESKYGMEKIGYQPTLEHVLPKNYKTNPKWRRYVRDNYAESDDEKAMAAFINDIGNQTLLSGKNNSKVSNKFFLYKFKNYKSAYQITQELEHIDHWLPSDIEQRREQYAQRLALALRI